MAGRARPGDRMIPASLSIARVDSAMLSTEASLRQGGAGLSRGPARRRAFAHGPRTAKENAMVDYLADVKKYDAAADAASVTGSVQGPENKQ